MAPPAMPSAGKGPQPKISSGDSGMTISAPMQLTVAGVAMLPVPRITLDSELNSQTRTAPAKVMLE